MNQYGILTTQNPTDVAWSSSARAELPPRLLQAGPLEAEGLGAPLSPKGVHFYLTTAFAGHITATLPVLSNITVKRSHLATKYFHKSTPEVICCGMLGGGKGPCKMASSTSLRIAI